MEWVFFLTTKKELHSSNLFTGSGSFKKEIYCNFMIMKCTELLTISNNLPLAHLHSGLRASEWKTDRKFHINSFYYVPYAGQSTRAINAHVQKERKRVPLAKKKIKIVELSHFEHQTNNNNTCNYVMCHRKLRLTVKWMLIILPRVPFTYSFFW